jgi:hypothetical protein
LSTSPENAAEMPQYRCHKNVWALKIKTIALDRDAAKADGDRETDGSAMITPEEAGYAPFRVDDDYVRKHNPQAGGYYVVYLDGYKSFSPAKVFEEGYTLTDGEQARVAGTGPAWDAWKKIRGTMLHQLGFEVAECNEMEATVIAAMQQYIASQRQQTWAERPMGCCDATKIEVIKRPGHMIWCNASMGRFSTEGAVNMAVGTELVIRYSKKQDQVEVLFRISG